MRVCQEVSAKVEWVTDALLGEGPVWDSRTHTLFWLDIKGKRLYSFKPRNGLKLTISLPIEISAVAPRAEGGLVAATRDGFAFLAPEDGSVEFLKDPEKHLPNNRFNDGGVDMSGNFVAGSMDDLETNPTGTVYRLSADGQVTTLFGGYVVCNGPVFSPDGRTLYFSNSSEREILQFPYNPDRGAVGFPQPFARIEDADGYPDGLTVDADGCIWCAHWDGGKVTRFTPGGKVDYTVELPVPRVTSCAFGGDDYDVLYITTARWRMDNEALKRFPLSGSLFSVKPKVKGLALPLFS